MKASEQARFLAMLRRSGVIYETEVDGGGRFLVIIEAETGPQNFGYNSFATVFAFVDGALQSIGVWE